MSQDGGLFTFGAGSNGQLGHGTFNHELLPKKVVELMGCIVTQVACGRYVFVTGVYSVTHLDAVHILYDRQ